MTTIGKAYMLSFNEIQDSVEKAIKEDGQEILLKYSAYEWDENDLPINNLIKEIILMW